MCASYSSSFISLKDNLEIIFYRYFKRMKVKANTETSMLLLEFNLSLVE